MILVPIHPMGKAINTNRFFFFFIIYAYNIALVRCQNVTRVIVIAVVHIDGWSYNTVEPTAVGSAYYIF